LLDAPGFAGAGERLQQVRAQPRGERVGSAERGGQPFGGLEGAQGGVVSTAYELEHAAAVGDAGDRLVGPPVLADEMA